MRSKMKNKPNLFGLWNPCNKSYDDGFWVYQSGQIDHDYSTDCEEVVIQFFTGRKDRNKKAIYDGDIVEINENYIDDKYVSVEMQRGAWGFVCKSNGLLEWHNMFDYPCKIVGNIFETPELLKSN